MGDGSLSAAIADCLSATNDPILTCDQIAIGVEFRLGYKPAAASVSKIVGQRTDWRKTIAGGKIAFQRNV